MYTTLQAIFSDVDSAEAAVRALRENHIDVAARRIIPAGGNRRYDAEFAGLFGMGYANYQPGLNGDIASGTVSGMPLMTPVFAVAQSPGRNGGAASGEVILKVKVDENMVESASGILINRRGRKIQEVK